MIVRSDLRFDFARQRPFLEEKKRPQALRGWRLIGLLTAGLLFWLLYRWLGNPGWPAILPLWLMELVGLLETAALFTIAFLWSALWWRRRTYQPPAPAPVTRQQLYAMSPKTFEKYAAGLFRQKGYRVKLRGSSGDMGVDLELTQTSGKRAIVQCKRYRNTVGPEIIRELYGTLVHERAAHAFLVTTADISDAARQWARGKPMTLIDGATLVKIAEALQQSPQPA